MPAVKQGYAYNRTRQTYLATRLAVADTHWRRLVGLLGTGANAFARGAGLWIVPSRGVHTLAMRFPIDVIYLDRERTVVHLEEQLQPWRFGPVRAAAASVLELPCHTIRSSGTRMGDTIAIEREGPRELEQA